jgi:osmoprotectant transport system permease protein
VDFGSSLFDAWEQLLRSWSQSDDFWDKTLTFLSLTLRGLGLVLLLGIPAGILLTRLPRLAAPVIAVLALVQPIPSLALIGILFSVVSIGAPAALFAAVVYSLFPVVLNTHVGITQVSPAVRDAARGMGMTGGQILWRVELPLALPVILAGIRTGLVYVVGIMAVAALFGAGGLGDYILTGANRGDNGSIYLGVLPMLVITFVFFWGLGAIAWLTRRHSGLGTSVAGGLIVLLAGYAVAEPFLRPRRPDLVLGSKNFTEGRILTEILRLLLQAHTDLSIGVKHNLGSKLAYKALLRGDIDVYPEYTGNLLTGEDALNLPVPTDRSVITPLVREAMPRRFHLVMLEPFGLNNTYAPCTTKALAKKYRLRKISDLKGLADLRVVVDLEFVKRPDGWKGLLKAYGLHFRKEPIQIDPNLLYQPLKSGQADLVIGFATDWQIQAFDLVVLGDDGGYFPSYHAAPLVRESVLLEHPEVGRVLNKLAGKISDTTMRELNYQVAVLHRSEVEVAREFLQRQGLLK